MMRLWRADSEFTRLVREPSTESEFPQEEGAKEEGGTWLGCLGRVRWRRPYLVEPAFLIFELADWSSLALTTQYIYMRLAHNDTQLELKQLNSSDVNSTHSTPWEGAGGAVDSLPTGLSQPKDSQASYFVLYMNLLSNVPAVFITLLVCAYGDIVGRKPGLILPNMGGALKALVYLLVAYHELPLWTLAVGHLLEGFGGTHFTFTGSAHAYVADVVQPQHLTLRYTILQTLLLLASTVGNMGMGYLISASGFIRCFFLLTGLFLVGSLYIAGFLPESLRMKASGSPSFMQMLRGTLEAFKVYSRPRRLPLARFHLLLLLIVKLLNTIVFMGLVDVETLYLLGEPFCFTSVKIGYFLAESTVLNALGPLLVVPLLQTFCLCSDTNVCMISALSGALSFLVLGLAENQVMVFTAPALGGLVAGISPVARAMMSKRVEQDEQGALQASLSSLSVVSGIGGVSMYLAVYGATVNIFHGLVFLLVSALFGIITFLLMVIKCTQKYDQEESECDSMCKSDTTYSTLSEP